MCVCEYVSVRSLCQSISLRALASSLVVRLVVSSMASEFEFKRFFVDLFCFSDAFTCNARPSQGATESTEGKTQTRHRRRQKKMKNNPENAASFGGFFLC